MATSKPFTRYSATPVPFATSAELRGWLTEEFDAISSAVNGLVDFLEAPIQFLYGCEALQNYLTKRQAQLSFLKPDCILACRMFTVLIVHHFKMKKFIYYSKRMRTRLEVQQLLTWHQIKLMTAF